MPFRSLLLLAVIASMGACAAPTSLEDEFLDEGDERADGAPQPSRYVDPHLTLPAWDSGPVRGRCVVSAPWGTASWGVQAEAFRTAGNRSVDLMQVTARDGLITIHGEQNRNDLAFVRIIQGDVWGGTNCSQGPVPWHVFDGIPAVATPTRIKLRARIDFERHNRVSGAGMVAINVWLSSPMLPRGPDRFGRKPMVLDLATTRRAGFFRGGDGAFYPGETGELYRDQAYVDRERRDDEYGRFLDFDIDLTQHVRNACRRFNLSEPICQSLQLYQVEYLVELAQAQAKTTIDSFVIEQNGVSVSLPPPPPVTATPAAPPTDAPMNEQRPSAPAAPSTPSSGPSSSEA